MRHAPRADARAGLAVLLATTVFLHSATAEAAAVAALMPVGTLLTPSRLFGWAILAPTLLLAVGSLASFLMDLLRRNQDH
jgi:hypothetical protein